MYKLQEIFKNMFLVLLVYFTYQNVNILFNHILGKPMETVLIPGEPFGFATLYLLYYYVLTGIGDTIREARQKGDVGN